MASQHHVGGQKIFRAARNFRHESSLCTVPAIWLLINATSVRRCRFIVLSVAMFQTEPVAHRAESKASLKRRLSDIISV